MTIFQLLLENTNEIYQFGTVRVIQSRERNFRFSNYFEKQITGEYVLSIEGSDEKGEPWATSIKTSEGLKNL